MNNNSDKEFQKITADEPPRDLAILLNSFIPSNSTIVDLGCGSGIDSLYFIENGHFVIAIDREISVIRDKKKKLGEDEQSRLSILKADFNEITYPKADVIYASYSLPFCGSQNFLTTWDKHFETLKPNTAVGIVLFGQKDEWYAHNDYLAFHSDEEAKSLFKTFDIRHYENIEYLGKCMSSDGSIIDKHWNVINIVAYKK